MRGRPPLPRSARRRSIPHARDGRADPRHRDRKQVHGQRFEAVRAGAVPAVAGRATGSPLLAACGLERPEEPRGQLEGRRVRRPARCTSWRVRVVGLDARTSRPPLCMTRASDASAASGRSTCWSTATANAASKLADWNGSAAASAVASSRRHAMRRGPRVARRRRVARTRSMPTKCAWPGCSRARMSSAVPAPHPTSSTRSPGCGSMASRRKSVNAASHHRSRRCFNVNEVRRSMSRGNLQEVRRTRDEVRSERRKDEVRRRSSE